MLSINISELVITIANFFLLFFLLRKLLYKPLVTFMEERQSRIEAGLEEERKAGALLREKQADIDLQLEQSRREADEMLSKAKAGDADKHRQMLEKLHSETADVRQRAEQELSRLYQEDSEKLSAGTGEYAEKLVERLVQQARLG